MENKIQLIINYLEGLEDSEKKFAGAILSRADIDYTAFYEWEWPQGVALYGLVRHYLRTNDEATLNKLITWHEKMWDKEVPKNINTMAPMLSLAFLAEITKEEKYFTKCLEWSQWLVNDLGRTQENGFKHAVSERENEQELWDDTLMMTVLFLTKIGKITNNKEYVELAKYQFLVHAKYLFDKKTGLWFHGWTFAGNHNFADALWCRGNSWITLFIPDFIELLEEENDYFTEILKTYLVNQASKLKELQNENGLWHTLLDDPQSYLETSGSAGIGYGIARAIKNGFLDKDEYLPVLEKLNKALLENIDDNGEVQNVSYGTPMGHDLDFYRNIPITPMPYGQSLALLCLVEMDVLND